MTGAMVAVGSAAEVVMMDRTRSSRVAIVVVARGSSGGGCDDGCWFY